MLSIASEFASITSPNIQAGAPTTVQTDWDFVLNKRNLSLVSLVALLALCPSIAASEKIPKVGFYMGFGLNMAEESFARFNNGKSFDTGVGFVLNGGYRFHPNLAVEGMCEYMLGANSRTRDVNILSFTANIKGYLTTTRFQPFVLLGIGTTRVRVKTDGQGESSHIGLGNHFGGGFDYYLTQRFSVGITAAYVVTTRSAGNFNHTTISLAAQYRF
jgi:opacity protein-like surface antigen